jgi:hypothetical protein
LQSALDAISESWVEPVSSENYRTLERATAMMKAYVQEYPTESFTPVNGPSGPLIEVPTTADTGLTLDDGETIEYGGIFDGLVQSGDDLFVLEHKTCSALGSTYFDAYKPNNQVTGYTFLAGKLAGRPITGAIINALCLTRSGKISFARQITTRTPEDLQRWLMDLKTECQNIRTHERTGHWPMRTGSCTMYGHCEFWQVHRESGEDVQQSILQTHYVQEPWDFLSRDEVGAVTNGG